MRKKLKRTGTAARKGPRSAKVKALATEAHTKYEGVFRRLAQK